MNDSREVSIMTKRILAILLSLCILFCTVLTFADEWDDDWGDDDFGDEELDDEDFESESDTKDFRTIAGYDTGEKYTYEQFTYQLTQDGKNAVMIGYSGDSADVVIPDTVDGYPVIAIGASMFAYKDYVRTVQIPEGVLSIGNMAFFKCSKLESIVIPEGITFIDEACFGGCESLVEVQFPESLQEVGHFGFLSCLKLTEVSFPAGLKAIGSGAFQLCASLSKVSLPGGDNVTIEADSFLGCSPDLQITD